MLVLFTLTLRQLSVQQGLVPFLDFYISHREITDDANFCISPIDTLSMETLKTPPLMKLKHL